MKKLYDQLFDEKNAESHRKPRLHYSSYLQLNARKIIFFKSHLLFIVCILSYYGI